MIESEVARRMITTSTKVHNHRRRIDMILFAFDRRNGCSIRDRERGDVFFSAFRVLLRTAIYFGDVPRVATRRSHFVISRENDLLL